MYHLIGETLNLLQPKLIWLILELCSEFAWFYFKPFVKKIFVFAKPVKKMFFFCKKKSSIFVLLQRNIKKIAKNSPNNSYITHLSVSLILLNTNTRSQNRPSKKKHPSYPTILPNHPQIRLTERPTRQSQKRH